MLLNKPLTLMRKQGAKMKIYVNQAHRWPALISYAVLLSACTGGETIDAPSSSMPSSMAISSASSSAQLSSAANHSQSISSNISSSITNSSAQSSQSTIETPSFALIGFASLDAFGISGTTGGFGGEVVSVSDFASLQAAVNDHLPRIIEISGTIIGDSATKMLRVGSNKTIIGKTTDATLQGFGLNISGFSSAAFDTNDTCEKEYEGQFTYTQNVIIQNLTFTDNPDDAINVQCWSHHVWIDHNTITRVGDGAIDIKRGADYVTVSWNHIIAVQKSMLLGHDEGNYAQDAGHLHVTYHHNWFDETSDRHPRTRYCTAHVFNNWVYNIEGGRSFNYFIGAGVGSDIYADYNYFDVSRKEQATQSMGDADPGGFGDPKITWVDNNIIAFEAKIDWNTGDAFLPSSLYSYTPDAPESLPALIRQFGGAGKVSPATLQSAAAP